MSRDAKKCVVLVTGGAGFLGQHIIGLLQSRAHHVTEIRVLDVVAYENKLDYPGSTPVRQYTGSILDTGLVRAACTGVDSVLHVASVIDNSLLPDLQRSHDINVVGTRNIIDACRQCSVKRLTYCSTVDVVIGRENIYDGTESMAPPTSLLMVPYATTKAEAENMVLAANGIHLFLYPDASLTTLSLRPMTMYGEQDFTFMGAVLRDSRLMGRYANPECGGSKVDYAYVGNVAWGFVSTETLLAKDDGTRAELIGGEAFFLGDETPKMSMVGFLDSFLAPLGVHPFPFAIPCWLIKYLLYVVYFVLKLVSLFYRVNVKYGTEVFDFIPRTFLFGYEKARHLLDYEPLYTFEESKSRTMTFLKGITKSMNAEGNS